MAVPSKSNSPAATDWLAVIAGSAITLAVCGYQFGRSNHAVYLLEPMRLNDPTLLANDWWCASTLQYHGLFSRMSALLMRLNALQSAFIVMYLTLVALFHLAWWRITSLLGGGRSAYFASILLFYISAAGFGLGMYHVFQDSALLPSNIASVAMAWAIASWIGGRTILSAVCFGISGAFHLNYAIMGMILWPILAFVSIRSNNARWRDVAIAALALVCLCSISIVPAVGPIFERRGNLPLREFVDYYVRVRHPHHYDPSTWHPLLWLSYVWPFPLAAWYFKQQRDHPPTRKAGLLIVLFLSTQLLALLCAGVWYMSETLVQMSLWRFGVFPKLLSCTIAGIMITRLPPLANRQVPRAALIAVAGTLIGLFAMRAGVLTLFLIDDDSNYVELCRWVRQSTPRDATFLVPPGEQSMRFHGQRAVVVNFKGVPQLSAELPEWRARLETLLQIDLRRLPRQMDHAVAAIADRYRALDTEHLDRLASTYSASYVITERAISHPRWTLIHRSGPYHLYHVFPASFTRADRSIPPQGQFLLLFQALGQWAGGFKLGAEAEDAPGGGQRLFDERIKADDHRVVLGREYLKRRLSSEFLEAMDDLCGAMGWVLSADPKGRDDLVWVRRGREPQAALGDKEIAVTLDVLALVFQDDLPGLLERRSEIDDAGNLLHRFGLSPSEPLDGGDGLAELGSL